MRLASSGFSVASSSPSTKLDPAPGGWGGEPARRDRARPRARRSTGVSVRSRSPTVTVSLCSRRSRQTTTSADSPTAAIETMLIRWFRSTISTPGETQNDVAVAQARPCRPARRVNRVDPGASRPLHAQRDRHLPGGTPGAGRRPAPPRHAAVSDQLVHDPAGQVDRDAEADAFVAAAVRGDRVVDADHFALHVDERAARVAGVDRGVGLEEILIHDVGKLVHLPPAGADDPLADRVHQAERASQRHHPGSDSGLVAVSQPRRRQVVAVELEAPRCRPWRRSRPSPARSNCPSRKNTRILAGFAAIDHVMIGQDVKPGRAVAADDDARAGLLELPGVAGFVFGPGDLLQRRCARPPARPPWPPARTSD